MKANLTISRENIDSAISIVSAGESTIGRVVPDSKDMISALMQALEDLKSGKVDQIVIRKESDEG